MSACLRRCPVPPQCQACLSMAARPLPAACKPRGSESLTAGGKLSLASSSAGNSGKKQPRAKSRRRGKGNAHPSWWYLPKNTSSCWQRGAEELRGIGARVVGCSPTPAALGADARWAPSPRAFAVRLQRQEPAWPGALRSPPSPARRGRSPRAAARFRAGCRRPTCCCWAGWRGRRMDVGTAPGRQRGRGLFTPGK